MILSNKCSCGLSLIFLRKLCIHSPLECNHYKVLGLKPTATLSEIKSAFYELSKIHHPDKNRGCEKSEKKFKDVTAAYEILKNEKLRQKYDRQLYSSKMSATMTNSLKMDYDDEAERNFYEKTWRVKRRKYYGKTKHYDFDTWYEMHYGSYSTSNNYYKHQNPYSYQSIRKQSAVPARSYVYSLYLIFAGLLFLFMYHSYHQKK